MMRILLCLFVLLAVPAMSAETPFRFENTPGKLPKDVVPTAYRLGFQPDIEKGTFEGEASVDLDVRQPTRRCVLNALELNVRSAELVPTGPDQGAAALRPEIALDAAAQTCTLAFPRELPVGAYRLVLKFAGKINRNGAGLFACTYDDAAGGGKKTLLATQMEPTDARRMFPCWDEPAFRAKFTLHVIIPEGFRAVGNMPVEREQPLGGGLKQVSFATTPPMASYLVVLAAGELDAIEAESDGTKLHVYAPRGTAEQGRYALESAAKLLHFYNDYFGVRFPLPKLDLIAVPAGSFGGAMENWGGITFDASLLLFDPANSSLRTRQFIFEVLAHEMAHQWFGDLVTMGWWDNLWLNEGFAEWMGQAATDHFNPEWQYWQSIADGKETAMASDARATTHPIQQPVVSEQDSVRAFDEITYRKGQAFIRMLEGYLGPDRFRDGLRRYMAAHAYGNTTTADLWKSLSESSGQPVADIATAWTEQPGLPLVLVSRDGEKPDALHLRLSQRRFTVHAPGAAPLRWPIPLTYSVLGTKEVRATLLDGGEGKLLPGLPAGSVVKFNAGDRGYYRVSYDAATLRALLDHLPELTPADQNNLLHDAWAAVQADLGPATDYLRFVEALRPETTDPLLWPGICDVAMTVDRLHLGGDPTARAAWRRAVNRLLRPVFARCGWTPAANEGAPVKNLRSTLISTLGALDDPATVRGCQERFAAFLKDPGALPPDVRGAALTVVGRHADATTYDALLALARKAPSDEEKNRCYGALASANDPALARRTLALTLTDELPAARALRVILNVAEVGEQVDAALAFTLEHQDAILAKAPPLFANLFVSEVFAASTDVRRAEELEALAGRPGSTMDATQVKKAAERIRTAAELKARVLPETARWAAAKGDAALP